MSEALEISEVKAGTAEAEVDLAQIGEPGRGGDQTQRRRRDVSLESWNRSQGITTNGFQSIKNHFWIKYDLQQEQGGCKTTNLKSVIMSP